MIPRTCNLGVILGGGKNKWRVQGEGKETAEVKTQNVKVSLNVLKSFFLKSANGQLSGQC